MNSAGGGRLVGAVGPDLAQAEQVEMVDQEGAEQDDRPAQPEQRPQHHRDRTGDGPDDAGHRPPLPEQQDQRQAGEEHIGRPLDRLGHEPFPPGLEGRPRHQAVLDREDPEQDHIDDERLGKGDRRPGVDALGDEQVADEAYGVEKGDEEDRIGDCSVHDSKPPHVRHPPMIKWGNVALFSRNGKLAASPYRRRPVRGSPVEFPQTTRDVRANALIASDFGAAGYGSAWQWSWGGSVRCTGFRREWPQPPF